MDKVRYLLVTVLPFLCKHGSDTFTTGYGHWKSSCNLFTHITALSILAARSLSPANQATRCKSKAHAILPSECSRAVDNRWRACLWIIMSMKNSSAVPL